MCRFLLRSCIAFAFCSCCVRAVFVSAAVIAVTDHGPNPNFDPAFFNAQLSNDDLLAGLIAQELPGDNGWHPANTNPADQLPAFTDGLGGTNTLTGLLNDFPDAGTPAKVIQYDLNEPSTIQQINILTGNRDNPDGRIFNTVLIRVSTDDGISFMPLGGFVPGLGPNDQGYYQSDPSGAINRPGGSIDDFGESMTTFLSIFDDLNAPLAMGVTNIQFEFFAVDNTGGQNRDPFDGVNPFTGIDDELTAAFVSPLVWEIDVIAGDPANADFDGDDDVDGKDFLTWQKGYPITDGTALRSDGDATGDGNVTDADLAAWEAQAGAGLPANSLAATIPEPTTLAVAMAALGSMIVRGRRRRTPLSVQSVTGVGLRSALRVGL